MPLTPSLRNLGRPSSDQWEEGKKSSPNSLRKAAQSALFSGNPVNRECRQAKDLSLNGLLRRQIETVNELFSFGTHGLGHCAGMELGNEFPGAKYTFGFSRGDSKNDPA
jgi:hypothetical protein